MEKTVQRVAGCLLADVLGVALLPLMQASHALHARVVHRRTDRIIIGRSTRYPR